MKSTVEALEGNKVKLSVEVDESEFDKAIDVAFKKIAREVRIPGFRPGKAPRKILEARLGPEVGREQALRDALPEFYVDAVKEHDVDVIAAPEIEITDGQEAGPVSFDAVVEIRPVITVGGYQGLRVELPRPEASEEEIDAQVDRLRQQFAELTAVERPAQDGDHVSIGITGSRDGEVLPGLQADDYLYELGSGAVAAELDDNLRGAKVGDVLEFDAQPDDPDEDPVQFKVIVKDIKEKVLPTVDDEWANDVSEFETVAYRKPASSRAVSVPDAYSAVYRSPWPGGHHSRSGSAGHSTGLRSSVRSLGSRFCRKSSGSPSTRRSGYAASAASVSSRVRKLFIRTSGSRAPVAARATSTCSAMRSRNVRPPRTRTSDLARSMPIDVPSPPLSLRTAVTASARRPASSSTSRSARYGTRVRGVTSSSAMMPVSPDSSSP